MNKSTRINISFSVEIKSSELPFVNFSGKKKYVVALTGSTEQLGNWMTEKCVVCHRVEKSDKGEVWSCDVRVPFTTEPIKYRYLITEITDYNDEGDDSKHVKVLAWESFMLPRSLVLIDYLSCSNGDSNSRDTFGEYNGQKLTQRGWLNGQTELLVRIHGSAIKWYRNRINKCRLYITCRKYMINHEDEALLDAVEEEVIPNGAAVVRRWSQSSIGLHKAGEEAMAATLSYDQFVTRPAGTPWGGFRYVQGDYLTFCLDTTDLESTAVELEFRVDPEDSSGSFSGSSDYGQDAGSHQMPKLVGTARIGPFDELCSKIKTHIVDWRKNAIGDIQIHYMAITSLTGYECSMETSWQRHWKKRPTLHVGHRGTGSSYSTDANLGVANVKENTLEAFRAAHEHGADLVEFDVQLSKDHHVIVYHDFRVCMTLRKKRRGDLQYFEIPVKDLNLNELQALKLSHSSVLHKEHTNDDLDEEDLDPFEMQPFPLLRTCFETSDPDLGYNIEVKYPMKFKDGSSEQDNFFERNMYVDKILKEILVYAGSRRILLSSFDPDICIMLQLKQNRYPVLQLASCEDNYWDQRMYNLNMNIYHSLSFQLLGVCFNVQELLSNPTAMDEIRRHKLVVFTWGETGSETRSQLHEIGVDGIIYDRIHEERTAGSLNVFKMERERDSASLTNSYESSTISSGASTTPDLET